MKIDGACHCGYITIEGEADPEKVAICHCTDNHYVVLSHASSGSLEFLDPAFGKIRCRLNAAYPSLSGVVLVFRDEAGGAASRGASLAREQDAANATRRQPAASAVLWGRMES